VKKIKLFEILFSAEQRSHVHLFLLIRCHQPSRITQKRWSY